MPAWWKHRYSSIKADLIHLIAMTPYAYKAKAERRQALEQQTQFDVTAQHQIYLFQKK